MKIVDRYGGELYVTAGSLSQWEIWGGNVIHFVPRIVLRI